MITRGMQTEIGQLDSQSSPYFLFILE